jgi:rhodanese-related sulfurtransferase
MSDPMPYISPAEAMKMQASSKVLMLDVRSAAEIMQSGTVRGALCIPAIEVYTKAKPNSDHFEKRFAEAETIIVFCAVGARSEAVAHTLARLGYGDVRNMKRFGDWVAAGGPVQMV